MNIKKLVDNILSVIYVKDIKCIYCNHGLDEPKIYGLCDKCYSKLKFNNNLVCKKCGIKLFGEVDLCRNCNKNKRAFEKVISVFEYDGIVKSIIRKFKFCDQKFMGEYLGKFMVKKYIESDIEADIVISVPLHIDTFKKRGYNQAEELALSFKDVLPVGTCLIKTKKTKEQAKSDFKIRKNI